MTSVLLEPIDPKVWNVRDPDCPENVVYVGRPSEYGNDYVIGRDGTRDDVIRKFEDNLTDGMKEKIKLELRGKHLSCWCSPKRCHADVLFRIANS